MDRLKVGEVAKSFNIDPQTVREWSEQFSEFLSPEANPPKGATRYYSQDDVVTLAFVYRSRRGDATFDEIREAMSLGQHRLTMPNLVPPPDSGLGGLGRSLDLVRPSDDSEKLRGQLEAVTGERDYLREALKNEQVAHGDTRERAAKAEERAQILEASKALPAPSMPVITSETRSTKLWQWLIVASAIAIIILLVVLVSQGFIR